MGLAIERVSGQSYADYVENEVIRAAGLRDTRYSPDAQDYPRAAVGYRSEKGALVPVGKANMKLPFSAGALCSTASDLVTWLESLSHGKVVGRAGFARMGEPVALTTGKTYPYGLGLAPRELAGHGRVGHHGEIDGFGGTFTTTRVTSYMLRRW